MRRVGICKERARSGRGARRGRVEVEAERDRGPRRVRGTRRARRASESNQARTSRSHEASEKGPTTHSLFVLVSSLKLRKERRTKQAMDGPLPPLRLLGPYADRILWPTDAQLRAI